MNEEKNRLTKKNRERERKKGDLIPLCVYTFGYRTVGREIIKEMTENFINSKYLFNFHLKKPHTRGKNAFFIQILGIFPHFLFLCFFFADKKLRKVARRKK